MLTKIISEQYKLLLIGLMKKRNGKGVSDEKKMLQKQYESFYFFQYQKKKKKKFVTDPEEMFHGAEKNDDGLEDINFLVQDIEETKKLHSSCFALNLFTLSNFF